MPLDPKIMAMDDSREIYHFLEYTFKCQTMYMPLFKYQCMNMKILVICLNVWFFFLII